MGKLRTEPRWLWPAVALALGLATVGCGRYGLDPEGRADADAGSDADADALADADGGSDADADAVADADGGSDADADAVADADADVTPDADADADVTPDADADLESCGVEVDDDTLLYLSFDVLDGRFFGDGTGRHLGILEGSGATLVPGRPGCGMALHFPAVEADGPYVMVPESSDWDLAAGSIDLWVRFDEDFLGGIVSRDEDWTDTTGHLSVQRDDSGGLGVRLQSAGVDYFRCSGPVTAGEWHHVALNFGPPTGLELFVDGVRAVSTTSTSWGHSPGHTIGAACDNTPCTSGIVGNHNPWVVGASSHSSDPGSAEPVYYSLGGAVDDFRVSRAQRDFER